VFASFFIVDRRVERWLRSPRARDAIVVEIAKPSRVSRCVGFPRHRNRGVIVRVVTSIKDTAASTSVYPRRRAIARRDARASDGRAGERRRGDVGETAERDDDARRDGDDGTRDGDARTRDDDGTRDGDDARRAATTRDDAATRGRGRAGERRAWRRDDDARRESRRRGRIRGDLRD